MIALSPISWLIFDEYGIQYHFMRKILKKRWLYSAVTYSLLLTNLLLLILAWFFPSWWLYILGGIWIGTIGQLPPLNHGIRSVSWLSYKQSYDIYVTQAGLWEKNLKKNQEKRARQKNKRKSRKWSWPFLRFYLSFWPFHSFMATKKRGQKALSSLFDQSVWTWTFSMRRKCIISPQAIHHWD